MSEETKKITMSEGELENIRAAERVQTSLMILIDDFKTHKEDDKVEFHKIGTALHRIEQDVHSWPERMAKCRSEMNTENDKKFITIKEVRAGFFILGVVNTVLVLYLKFGVH